MTELNVDSLQNLASRTRAKKTSGRPAWRPPELGDIHPGTVLSFDQSLGATGVVALIRTEAELTVFAAASFKTSYVAQGGHEENFRKTLELTRLVRCWIEDTLPVPADWSVVHEMPPVGGGRLNRPESSIMSALAVRYAAELYGMPVQPMIARKTHAKFTCGDGNVPKKEHHAALMETVSRWNVIGLVAVTNEGRRDALSVGLTHLARGHG